MALWQAPDGERFNVPAILARLQAEHDDMPDPSVRQLIAITMRLIRAQRGRIQGEGKEG